MGTAKPRRGRSRIPPEGDVDDVIHAVPVIRSTACATPGRRAAAAAKPGGNRPGTHIRIVRGSNAGRFRGAADGVGTPPAEGAPLVEGSSVAAGTVRGAAAGGAPRARATTMPATPAPSSASITGSSTR